MSAPHVENSVVIISDDDGQPEMFTPPHDPETSSEDEEEGPKVFTPTKNRPAV